jgi:glycosyltransferase involved in cell wall biosynthesis
MTPVRTVLYDLTPLDTESRIRGIGRYVRELAVGLSRLGPADSEGLRILGLTRLGWDGSYHVTEDIGSFEGNLAGPLTKRDHYRWAYRRRLALWRAVRRIRPDVVHLGDPNATPLGMSLVNCARVVTCHDLIPCRFPDRYFTIKDGGPVVGRWIERRRFASADLVVAISDATRDDLVSLLGLSPDKVVRVYNGVDVEKWSAAGRGDDAVVERHGLRGPYALYVGDGDWRKNAEGMVGGVAKARAAGVPIVLAWAGKLSSDKVQRITGLAKTAGIGPALRLLGFVPDGDLGSLLRKAAVHLFVSRAEGFGLTVVEAMAAGCPVITTRSGSLAEIAGEAAIEVDPEDHEAIGLALVRVCTDTATRETLIAKGRERAPRFTHDAQARAMADVYRRVMPKRAGSSSPPG